MGTRKGCVRNVSDRISVDERARGYISVDRGGGTYRVPARLHALVAVVVLGCESMNVH